MTTLASLSDLTVTYRRAPAPALTGLSLDIEAGEILAIIGESGSGKSTLARAIAGLLPERTEVAGTLRWPGLDGAPRAGRDIGYVFQDPGSSLNPVLSIGEQVGEGARRHLGLSRRAADAKAVRLLTRVHLPEPQRIARAYPHQLSGGQRQRVAIAAAIAARPRLLIADEVTSALDVLVQAAIVDLLVELVRADGMTLVFVTHDLALASGIADRVAVMAEGRLVELGPAAQVVAAPKAAETAALIAAHIDLATPPLIGEAP
ncbi:ABC transporter ATP-binding protein [Pleomorphomonas oryzae]|uniref:ABC transporter ATP-binding protein n=1 Tax=Pleomorphomonas oryzae TaxID=261934 RepID=UPI000426BE4C|nr:ABC transporter ATP-binding protein [Pleomorphomonas oryzae]